MNIENTDLKSLIEKALDMRNDSYGVSNCAERTALFHAVSEGVKEFDCIVITGGPEEGELQFCAPCGICRQALREFCDPKSFEIILAKSTEDYRSYTLEQLLPESFGPENLVN